MEVEQYLNDIKNKRIKRSRRLGGSIAVIHNVTPDVAQLLLNRAVVVNREVRQHHVANFVTTIGEKDFHPLINSIKANNEGEIIDGQHRLLAIVAADVTVQALYLVVLGRDEAKSFIDSDMAVRNEQDSQRIVGKKPLHGSIIGGLALERNNFTPGKENKRIRRCNAEASPHLQMVSDLYRWNTKVTSGVLAAAVRCARVDKDASLKFFRAVLDKENTRADIDGIHIPEMSELRTILVGHRVQKLAGFPRLRGDALRCIVTFKSWFLEKNNRRNKAPNHDAFPSFGYKEWEEQIGDEIVAGKDLEQRTARVSEVCRLYRSNRKTRIRLNS
jgi:hypothetical protein